MRPWFLVDDDDGDGDDDDDDGDDDAVSVTPNISHDHVVGSWAINCLVHKVPDIKFYQVAPGEMGMVEKEGGKTSVGRSTETRR